LWADKEKDRSKKYLAVLANVKDPGLFNS
jgi:hypothetical protein